MVALVDVFATYHRTMALAFHLILHPFVSFLNSHHLTFPSGTYSVLKFVPPFKLAVVIKRFPPGSDVFNITKPHGTSQSLDAITKSPWITFSHLMSSSMPFRITVTATTTKISTVWCQILQIRIPFFLLSFFLSLVRLSLLFDAIWNSIGWFITSAYFTWHMSFTLDVLTKYFSLSSSLYCCCSIVFHRLTLHTLFNGLGRNDTFQRNKHQPYSIGRRCNRNADDTAIKCGRCIKR